MTQYHGADWFLSTIGLSELAGNVRHLSGASEVGLMRLHDAGATMSVALFGEHHYNLNVCDPCTQDSGCWFVPAALAHADAAARAVLINENPNQAFTPDRVYRKGASVSMLAWAHDFFFEPSSAVFHPEALDLYALSAMHRKGMKLPKRHRLSPRQDCFLAKSEVTVCADGPPVSHHDGSVTSVRYLLGDARWFPMPHGTLMALYRKHPLAFDIAFMRTERLPDVRLRLFPGAQDAVDRMVDFAVEYLTAICTEHRIDCVVSREQAAEAWNTDASTYVRLTKFVVHTSWPPSDVDYWCTSMAAPLFDLMAVTLIHKQLLDRKTHCYVLCGQLHVVAILALLSNAENEILYYETHKNTRCFDLASGTFQPVPQPKLKRAAPAPVSRTQTTTYAVDGRRVNERFVTTSDRDFESDRVAALRDELRREGGSSLLLLVPDADLHAFTDCAEASDEPLLRHLAAIPHAASLVDAGEHRLLPRGPSERRYVESARAVHAAFVNRAGNEAARRALLNAAVRCATAAAPAISADAFERRARIAIDGAPLAALPPPTIGTAQAWGSAARRLLKALRWCLMAQLVVDTPVTDVIVTDPAMRFRRWADDKTVAPADAAALWQYGTVSKLGKRKAI